MACDRQTYDSSTQPVMKRISENLAGLPILFRSPTHLAQAILCQRHPTVDLLVIALSKEKFLDLHHAAIARALFNESTLPSAMASERYKRSFRRANTSLASGSSMMSFMIFCW